MNPKKDIWLLLDTAKYPLLFVFILWVVFALEAFYNTPLTFLGVSARNPSGAFGIVTSVFIHGSLTHIASNTLPLIVLGSLLFYFYSEIAFAVFLWIWIVSGIWLWIGGRNSENHPVYHIGASTLIYGLATFLFFSGVIRRHRPLMVVSALVVFLYGSIMWGIFPLREDISWEGHLFGAIAGALVAIHYRKEGPQKKVFEWEDEDVDENADAEWKQGDDANRTDFIIRYHLKNDGRGDSVS